MKNQERAISQLPLKVAIKKSTLHTTQYAIRTTHDDIIMRIIGGTYRGKKIEYPGHKGVRPTKDRVRESVFNMIAEWVPGARVLDLFSGSGAYGLESLSRGAENAVFVDNDPRCGRVITKNIELLESKEKARVIAGDVFRTVKLFGEKGEKFDLIFSDPPFNKGMSKKTLLTVIQYDILNRPGLFVMEHHKEEPVPGSEFDVSIFKQKTYKDITITLYIKK